MTLDEYLLAKKINARLFEQQEPQLYAEWKRLFEQLHPESFTAQKKFLINDVRRRFLVR